ncbi:MAG: hypothetical protein QNJ88_05830 [Acidimicrobiia bacterium]|nr:hypothetical protein [Acidimicrobiia bacterium]
MGDQQQSRARGRRFLTLLASVLVVVFVATTAVAITRERSGVVGELTIKTSNDASGLVGTSDWVAIEDAEVTVSTETNATVVVDFMATSLCESIENPRARCMVRVMVDGKKAQPGRVIFDSDYSPDLPKGHIDDQYAAHSMRWAKWVPAGDHTVTVEWKPAGLPTTFSLRAWSLTVMTAE